LETAGLVVLCDGLIVPGYLLFHALALLGQAFHLGLQQLVGPLQFLAFLLQHRVLIHQLLETAHENQPVFVHELLKRLVHCLYCRFQHACVFGISLPLILLALIDLFLAVGFQAAP
jgi:hypothetical protein